MLPKQSRLLDITILELALAGTVETNRDGALLNRGHREDFRLEKRAC